MNDSQPHSIEHGGQWLEQLVSETPELVRARDYGVDLWTLIANLHRTPEERIRRHETALSTLKLLYQSAHR